MSSDGPRYQIVEGVLERSVGDGIVLYGPETEQLLTLDACGARIWQLLSEEQESARIVARLTDEFSGAEAVIRQETLEFLSQLEGKRLIRKVGALR